MVHTTRMVSSGIKKSHMLFLGICSQPLTKIRAMQRQNTGISAPIVLVQASQNMRANVLSGFVSFIPSRAITHSP